MKNQNSKFMEYIKEITKACPSGKEPGNVDANNCHYSSF